MAICGRRSARRTMRATGSTNTCARSRRAIWCSRFAIRASRHWGWQPTSASRHRSLQISARPAPTGIGSAGRCRCSGPDCRTAFARRTTWRNWRRCCRPSTRPCERTGTAGNDIERAARQAHLQQAESDFEALPFDAAAARAFGRVASELRSAGRKTSARASDALIASEAISQELPLYMANADDFRGISGLDLVEVAVPDKP